MNNSDAKAKRLIDSLEELTGQPIPLPSEAAGAAVKKALHILEGNSPAHGLGYSQFNELLLLLGYDRIVETFFQYLVDQRTEYAPGSAIESLEQLQNGVSRFRKHALLLFGNIKYAFKNLSRDAEDLTFWLDSLTPLDDDSFKNRHEPVQDLIQIAGEDTFYLGYLVQRELRQRLEKDPEDKEALKAEARRQEIVEAGNHNHQTYLASDHLDVYIATSMRERHEYLLVSKWTQEIFGQPSISPLKLRWFDPTQAYCQDRIDKGLSEALMLKRARCTVYFVQETDTLGKDSELASTLAQGKPVIAFVPSPTPDYIDDLLNKLRELYPDKLESTLLLEQLRIFEPSAAWNDSIVRKWLNEEHTVDVQALRTRLSESIVLHYNKRAEMLSKEHPLGIQVNLATGVANGVLVVRTIQACAELIRRVVTRNLEFDLDTNTIREQKYVLLREKVSSCIFRVMTGDAMLTNAFWNFYLDPAD